MASWKRLTERPLHVGYRTVYLHEYLRPDGAVQSYEILREADVACVLPVTEAGLIVLAKQFRPGPERDVLELPGGLVDEGESPERAAERELAEETGMAGRLRYLGPSLAGAYTTRVRHNFLATGCRKVRAARDADEERIDVVELTVAAFREHLRSGQLSDMGAGYLALEALGLLTP